MAKELTDLQKKFLDVLFDEAGGNYKKALLLAGYDKNTRASNIVKQLRDEIIERARDVLVANAANSVNGLLDIAKKPSQMGGKVKLDAIKEILDRAGLQKVEKQDINVHGEGGVFILPAKDVE